MKLDLYQIDAFASEVFGGNPAAVVPLNTWLPDKIMQAIAMENNLAETAFFVKRNNLYEIRWFTPTVEVDLCGHATLASAHVLFKHLEVHEENILFKTLRRGNLKVTRNGELLNMDFPVDLQLERAEDMKEVISESIGHPVLTCVKGTDDFLVEVNKEAIVQNLAPDLSKIAKLKARGLLVTARSSRYDFVSRCFFPQSGIDEDPVTGSAHTLLTPFWAAKLGKNQLEAKQVSTRGGEISCHLVDDRVILGGKAITYLSGKIEVPNGLS